MAFHGIQRSAEWLSSLIFGKVQNVDVLQAKSPIKVAVKSGSKLVEKVTLDNDINISHYKCNNNIYNAIFYCQALKSLVLEKIEAFFDQYIFKTAVRAVLFGIILTIMVQSSSITTSLVVP